MRKSQDHPEKKAKVKDQITHKNVEKSQNNHTDANACCTNPQYLKISARLLLALGVVIIIGMLYLAIMQTSGTNNAVTMNGKVKETEAIHLAYADMVEALSGGIQKFRLEEYASRSKSNKNERLSLANLDDQIQRNLNRCKEDSCKIACGNVADIFTALHDVIKRSLCSSIDVLVLANQSFPLGILKNNWLPVNISFNEVIIRFSEIMTIKSGAFNVSLFHNALVLSLYNRHIINFDSGVLLGFKRLKYLTIQSYLKEFHSSALQPVQHSLLGLKLNSRLNIEGAENLFDGSFLFNLAYMDLSHNIFSGSLGKQFFESTPNVKYLIIKQSQIQHVEHDAFENLAHKLLYLNLAQNRLTTLSAGLFQTILMGQHQPVINLADNDWICNCQLKQFVALYQAKSPQFMHVLYCKSPHHLYGTTLDEVDYDLQNCTTEPTSHDETTAGAEQRNFRQRTTTHDYQNGIYNTTPLPVKLKMRCFDEDHSSSSEQANELKPQVRSSHGQGLYMGFPAPDFEFDLKLIAHNNSVNVTIANPSDIYFVIWFSARQESAEVSYADKNLDYECMRYDTPYLIVSHLQDNTTYTFCVLPSLKNDISPFNCVPLHVPPKSNEDVWISVDKKRFTIGVLCLTFLLSTLAGGALAYLGIRTFPNALESSKNVLVLKKPEQAYVATISEIEYQKQSTVKKHKNPSAKNQSIIKLPLPATPPPTTSPTPCRMSVKDLERISCGKSCSTFFQDTPPGYNLIDDKYERPNNCSDEYVAPQCNVKNTYSAMPGSPPPLPKRNSGISDSSTLVLSRLSKNRDVL